MVFRASPAWLPPVHSFGPWPISVASLLRTPEGSVGSGNWIPLSLIKMQTCTVNEGSNLEAIWPGQVSHQLLFSVGRLDDECSAPTGHIWAVPREERFPPEEDTVCRNCRFAHCRVCLLQTRTWGLMVGSSGIRCPGLGSQPHRILSVLCQAVCEPLWALVSFSVK